MTPPTGFPIVTFFIESGHIGAQIAYGEEIVRGYGTTPWSALAALASKIDAMSEARKRAIFGVVLDTLERVGVKVVSV